MCCLPLPTFWVCLLSPFCLSCTCQYISLSQVSDEPSTAVHLIPLDSTPAKRSCLTCWCSEPATAIHILLVYPHHVTCFGVLLGPCTLKVKADVFLKMLGSTCSMANGSVTSHKTWALVMKFSLYSHYYLVVMAKLYAGTVVKLSYVVHIHIISF